MYFIYIYSKKILEFHDFMVKDPHLSETYLGTKKP